MFTFHDLQEVKTVTLSEKKEFNVLLKFHLAMYVFLWVSRAADLLSNKDLLLLKTMQQGLYKYLMHLFARYLFCYPRDHYFCSDEFHKNIHKTVVMEVV